MPSKYDEFRSGIPLEIEGGVKVRLNPKNQTLEFSTGKVLPLTEEMRRRYIPENESEKKHFQFKEDIEQKIYQHPLGESAGQLLYQTGQTGVFKAGQDWIHKFTMDKGDYNQRKLAEQEISGEISQESPYLSAGGTALGYGAEALATGGLRAAVAAPILAAAGAGPRILEEPGKVAGEAALASAGGFAVDKAFSGLQKMAQRRAASRAIPGQVERVRAENIAGAAEVEAQNVSAKQNFFAEENSIKAQNVSILKKYEGDLLDRKNQMIQANNAYEKAKVERMNLKGNQNAEVKRQEKLLLDEYNLKTKEYQESLKNMPAMQKKAQQEYSQNVVRNSEQIQKVFPKDSKIYSQQIGLDDFFNNTIDKTGLAASKEGMQAKRILKSLFNDAEGISSKELSSRYKSIEEAIQRSAPETSNILNQFKNHLGEKLPLILEDSLSYQKVIPMIKRYIEKDVVEILKKVPGIPKSAIGEIRSNSKNALKNIDSNNFVNRIQNGELTKQIASEIAPLEKFSFLSKEDLRLIQSGRKLNKQTKEFFEKKMFEAQQAQQAFIEGLTHQLNHRMGLYEITSMGASKSAQKKLGTTLRDTYGTAPEITSPTAPTPPAAILPPTPIPEIVPPSAPPLPGKPDLVPPPTAPIPNRFNPTPEPSLPPAQGLAERLGDVLEKPLIGQNLKNIGSINPLKNPLVKMGALKYALGKAAYPVEAAGLAGYAGLKGLTAPGAEGARQSFKLAGVAAIEAMAQKYPSYNAGILDSPLERRSLTKEIEVDPEIPPTQKAIFQSKVNRGIPLESRLQ